MKPPKLTLLLTVTAAVTAFAQHQQAAEPKLLFIEPNSGSHYEAGAEVPFVLSAYAPDDVFASAELFANGEHFANAVYCCPLCPCAVPTPGITTTLQIPGDPPPADPWRGWVFTTPGIYTLTARSVGENGKVLQAGPITISVAPPLDLSLHVTLNADGTLRFWVPEGSLTPHGMAMEMSHDLIIWQRIGMLDPGNVAAFYVDHPDPADTRPRFYRAIKL
jgi:hypothetical protein